MVAFVPRIRRANPLMCCAGLAVVFLPLYLPALFLVGALTAAILGAILLRWRLRLATAVGGGFSGLAAWFTVLVNHREQYEWLVNLLCRFLSKNWAAVVIDFLICATGASLFVAALALSQWSARTLKTKVMSRFSTPDEPPKQESVETL